MTDIALMEELVQAAERARQALVEYDKLAMKLIQQTENKALAHQCIVQASLIAKGPIKSLDETAKFAVENISGSVLTEQIVVCGYTIPAMQYKPSKAISIELLDKSDKTWAHILKACSEVEPKAVQQRLVASVFTDKKKGEELLSACLGMVGIKESPTTSITKAKAE